MNDFTKKFFETTAIDEWTKRKPSFKKRVNYKHYLRFKKLFWNKDNRNSQLDKLLIKRRSFRNFSKKPVSLAKIGKLLTLGCGKILLDRNYKDYLRSYPSAGARYPLEVYAISVDRRNEIPIGIHHYNILFNCLEQLSDVVDRGLIKKIFRQDFIENVSVFLVITACMNRNIEKYGVRGLRYILIEAGHMAQNFYLISTEQKLKCCAIGAFLDKKLADMLFLNSTSELPVYVLAIGN